MAARRRSPSAKMTVHSPGGSVSVAVHDVRVEAGGEPLGELPAADPVRPAPSPSSKESHASIISSTMPGAVRCAPRPVGG
ncbi:hypothetical protein ACFWP3_31225 [Streptomyces sp. NPDC058525]|uniref:hypothetical protein n=1 Tax=Streptomyces sp. NPDC058525 TaxID=3346538 RepID=UPI00364DC8FC